MEGSSRSSNSKRCRKQGRKAADQIAYSGPSYVHLPKDILIKIFLKLSVMSICICKSVCKPWYAILSDHSFAQLHFNQVRIFPLLRSSGVTFSSRLLYLVQPEQVDFERNLDMCDHENTKSKCLYNVRVKLDARLILPVRNLEKILINRDDSNLVPNPISTGGAKLRRKDHKYDIVNSCNGLLCLCDPVGDNAVSVCNPVTGEFINLPESEVLNGPIVLFNGICCGFGYTPKTNQYKVIQMFTHFNVEGNGFDPNLVVVTEINVLGTDTWRNIGFHPHSMRKKFPTYCNGYLFWFTYECVVIFDVEKEVFMRVSLPPLRNRNQISCQSMGVLGEDLCITDQYADDICIWVMSDYPSSGAHWRKIFETKLFPSLSKWPRGLCQPLKYLNDGAILIFHAPTNAFIYKDPRKIGYKYLKVRGVKAKLEVIPHIPSFISLKDVLSGSNMEVTNINSRCTELKLHSETKCVSLVEEEYRYG